MGRWTASAAVPLPLVYIPYSSKNKTKNLSYLPALTALPQPDKLCPDNISLSSRILWKKKVGYHLHLSLSISFIKTACSWSAPVLSLRAYQHTYVRQSVQNQATFFFSSLCFNSLSISLARSHFLSSQFTQSSKWQNLKCSLPSLAETVGQASWRLAASLLNPPPPEPPRGAHDVSDLHSQELSCQSHSRTAELMKRQRKITSMNYEWVLTAGWDSACGDVTTYKL